MTDEPRIALLYGGVSAEREVSLGSGAAAAASLIKRFAVDEFNITSEKLPSELDAARHVVFSTLHGTFGEDGRIQKLFDEAGVVYAGCDAASSALTFDKVATKRVLRDAGVPVLNHIVFQGEAPPSVEQIIDELGESIVMKPVAEGSSVGLGFACGVEEIKVSLAERPRGARLVEPRISGREGTVGVLDGAALALVEIRAKSGRFDYASKYTKGLTEYIAPAQFNEEFTSRVRSLAERAFEACGCRDWARLDFMVDAAGDPYFLEINTLPGLKETSLLPMSAGACGYNFDELLQKLVAPALIRYKQKYSVC